MADGGLCAEAESGAERAAARCVSPAFVSHVRPKPRLVIDLRDVNELLEDKPFKYEALPEFIASLQLYDHLISWDINDAFHHVYIHPDDRTYLSFTIDGEVYEAITMPFGLSIAPWAWTKVMRPVLAHLCAVGFDLIGYVDDHGAAAPAQDQPARLAQPPASGWCSGYMPSSAYSCTPRRATARGRSNWRCLASPSIRRATG